MSTLTSHPTTWEVAHTVITVAHATRSEDVEALARRQWETSGVDPFPIADDAEYEAHT